MDWYTVTLNRWRAKLAFSASTQLGLKPLDFVQPRAFSRHLEERKWHAKKGPSSNDKQSFLYSLKRHGTIVTSVQEVCLSYIYRRSLCFV